VAFGSDDPMSRPVERYPVNHHLAQILEREVAIVGLRAGPGALEVTWFDGDEPQFPAQWPNGRRFGDSYALRGSVRPLAGVEAQVSYAEVKSPEHRDGAGLSQRKWSASVRLDRVLAGRRVYAMAEYAHTAEGGGAFVFTSWLAESAADLGVVRPYLRLERTDRPEEARTADPFRTQWPPLDNSLTGITRWTIVTLGARLRGVALGRGLAVRPFAEGALAGVRTLTGAFDPAAWYGGRQIASLTAGLRLDWGMEGHRMGRYGTGLTDHGETMHGMPAMGGAR
ncbi:MAG TPA: hypothetical protein VFS28_01030, partial [Gemmatimonadales bacterium]|nr:hypothetical protein [Gemmatimonadales bacterium]